jgi:hypothetical protein
VAAEGAQTGTGNSIDGAKKGVLRQKGCTSGCVSTNRRQNSPNAENKTEVYWLLNYDVVWVNAMKSRQAPRPLRVFLCHASEDKPLVRHYLYEPLQKDGFDPWLDEEKIIPGQDWRLAISKALQSSDAIIVCLSRLSVTKEGYLNKELNESLKIAEEKTEGVLIPVRLNYCDIPDRLQSLQWVNLYRAKGYGQLLDGLRARSLGRQ